MQQPRLFDTPTALRAPHPNGTGYIPTWAAEQLEADKMHAAARTAKFHHCRRCGQPILTGLDHDDAAGTVHADPTPLTRNDETACIVIGRPTYEAQPHPPDGYRLHRRNHQHGQDRPTRNPIFPAHQCGARFPGFHPDPVGDTSHGWPHTEPDF